ncbi:hypothetical protein ES708_30871 [subsurface metagenome]
MAGAWWTKIGLLGEKAVNDTATLPTVEANLFLITGGPILMTSLIGELATVMSANATECKFQAVPTAGTATTRDLCTAEDIQGFAADDLIGLTGINTDALLPTAVRGSSGSIEGMTMPVVLPAGALRLDIDAPGQTTGSIIWTLRYVPLSPDSRVVSAQLCIFGRPSGRC